jgi:hypothetical protein
MSDQTFEGIEFDTPTSDAPEPSASISDAFELEEKPADKPEPEAEQEDSPEPEAAKADPDEDEARNRGWTSKDEWVKAGKDPDQWVNAKHFNEKGRLIAQARQLQELKGNFDKRLEGVATLYKAQINTLQAQNKQLQAARDEAITYGDVNKVKELDQQLMTNAVEQLQIQQSQQQSTTPQVDQAELEREAAWERNNQWISVNDPAAPEYGKAVYARQLYEQLLQQPMSVDDRLQTLERELSAKFPKTNPNRDKPAVTDAKTADRVSGKLTMADLTPDERQQWDSFGKQFFKDQKEFLQAVADTRKAGA